MKQKILEIMDDKIFIEYYGIHGKGHAAEEIAQMMCDEIFSCINCCVNLKSTIAESAMIRVSQLGFTPQQIDNALNKLK